MRNQASITCNTVTPFLIALGLLLSVSGVVRAQREFPSDKALMDAAGAQVDHDTAALMMKRAEAPGAAPLLDLDIDLRVIERWLLSQAAEAKAQSDEQIVAQLRAKQLEGAITALDEALRQAPAEFSPSQKDAAARLHQMSYKLDSSADAAKLDLTSRDVGALMLLASSPTAQDPKKLPIMRPAHALDLRATEPAHGSDPAAPQPATLAQLSDGARRAAVSPALRQQLLSLVNVAASSARDESHAKETAVLTATLADAVDIAGGLAGGNLSATARDAMDAQLAEGLALYSDVRTRSAGQARIAGLNQYRQVLVRENRIPLTADQRAKLAGLFAYCQANLTQSTRALDLVEKFAVQSARLDGLPKTPPALAGLKKANDDVRAECEQHRDGFLAAASATVAPASGAGSVATGPEAMESQINDLHQCVDIAELLQQVPAAVNLLQGTYKPKPVGNLERKTISSAVAASAPQRSAPRLEAIKTLGEIVHLANIAGPGPDKLYAEIPPSIAQQYAGGPLDKIAAKRMLLIGSAAAQLALGQDVEKNVLSRIQSMREIDNGLRLAARFEMAMQSWSDMTRWADVQYTPDQIRAATAPFQAMLISAYAGFMADTSESIDAFMKHYGRYVPLMKMVVVDSASNADCAVLPAGLQGALAQLLTPLDDQRFGPERYTSYALPILVSVDELDAQSVIVSAISRHIHPSPRLDDEPSAVKTSGKAAKE